MKNEREETIAEIVSDLNKNKDSNKKQEMEHSKDASPMQAAKDVALEHRESEICPAPIENYAAKIAKRGD